MEDLQDATEFEAVEAPANILAEARNRDRLDRETGGTKSHMAGWIVQVSQHN